MYFTIHNLVQVNINTWSTSFLRLHTTVNNWNTGEYCPQRLGAFCGCRSQLFSVEQSVFVRRMFPNGLEHCSLVPQLWRHFSLFALRLYRVLELKILLFGDRSSSNTHSLSTSKHSPSPPLPHQLPLLKAYKYTIPHPTFAMSNNSWNQGGHGDGIRNGLKRNIQLYG